MICDDETRTGALGASQSEVAEALVMSRRCRHWFVR